MGEGILPLSLVSAGAAGVLVLWILKGPGYLIPRAVAGAVLLVALAICWIVIFQSGWQTPTGQDALGGSVVVSIIAYFAPVVHRRMLGIR
ncbi:hypothetical protein [Magnetospira sp. QH-2]|uniref:hypothetical protein n=1 Tax=Magnetospira sp. (strain QH-2) TaxID=1288970 RepID=UPI0003E811E5|nr:hypothetical protein [Magnetospira sp. QH-2]CCQ72569.1 membrane protein of unknown function [Magnetospira sp. QH-2]